LRTRRGPSTASRAPRPLSPLNGSARAVARAAPQRFRARRGPSALRYHKRLFEKALKCHSGEQVSGLLLLYSSCVLHVIEVSYVNPFGDQVEIKVLVVSHNIPTRLFPDWYVTTVTPPVTYLQDATQSQSTVEVVAECLTLLFKLAAYVPKIDNLNNNLHTLAPELLIPAETINYLCNIEECASPEEFLRMYLNPLQPAMDSETVWPAPSHFFA
uniref:Uncharacterized protein n=1 Tax=Apteryx owenii TaxID=8824 RepID=A0A8B9P6V5_APTOW